MNQNFSAISTLPFRKYCCSIFRAYKSIGPAFLSCHPIIALQFLLHFPGCSDDEERNEPVGREHGHPLCDGRLHLLPDDFHRPEASRYTLPGKSDLYCPVASGICHLI